MILTSNFHVKSYQKIELPTHSDHDMVIVDLDYYNNYPMEKAIWKNSVELCKDDDFL